MRWLPDRPLPERAFIPGESPRPPDAGPPEVLDRPADEWRFDHDYLFGVDLYGAGFPWEAHEAWEGAWRAAADPARRDLLQGLIQGAAAVVKATAGAPAAARALAARGADHLDSAAGRAGSPFMGLDPGALAAGFRAWAAAPEPQPALRPALELRVRSRDLLGALTDTRVQPAGTELASRDRYLVMSTPERDDYNDGNLLILDRAPQPAEVEDRMADCRREFGARPVLYLSLCWEEEGDIRWDGASPVAGATEDDLQRLTVLSSAEAPEEPPAPEGIALRPLCTETEWPDLAALAIATHAPGDPGSFAVFARWRYREYHRTFAGPDPGRPDERGRFWGAFRGDRLVGSLGLFESPTLLRFQEVMTHPGERGRGIATALTARALHAGLARRPGAIAVVVAEPGEQAERIYRRLGFGTASTQVWLRRKAL